MCELKIAHGCECQVRPSKGGRAIPLRIGYSVQPFCQAHRSGLTSFAFCGFTRDSLRLPPASRSPLISSSHPQSCQPETPPALISPNSRLRPLRPRSTLSGIPGLASTLPISRPSKHALNFILTSFLVRPGATLAPSPGGTALRASSPVWALRPSLSLPTAHTSTSSSRRSTTTARPTTKCGCE